MSRKTLTQAPRVIEQEIAEAVWEFAMIGLAVYRDQDGSVAELYREELEAKASALESGLAGATPWLDILKLKAS